MLGLVRLLRRSSPVRLQSHASPSAEAVQRTICVRRTAWIRQRKRTSKCLPVAVRATCATARTCGRQTRLWMTEPPNRYARSGWMIDPTTPRSKRAKRRCPKRRCPIRTRRGCRRMMPFGPRRSTRTATPTPGNCLKRSWAFKRTSALRIANETAWRPPDARQPWCKVLSTEAGCAGPIDPYRAGCAKRWTWPNVCPIARATPRSGSTGRPRRAPSGGGMLSQLRLRRGGRRRS